MRLLTLVLVACALPAIAVSRAGGVADLEWLLGCWQSDDDSAREVWAAEADGSLLGFAVALDDGRVAFHELLSIKAGADGVPVYTAHPAGQSRTAFTAAHIADDSVRFVNPAHDYPQAIAYRLDRDRLIATISLLDGERPQTFAKRRCD